MPARGVPPKNFTNLEHTLIHTEEKLRDCGGVPVPARAAAGERGRVLPGLAHRPHRQLAPHPHGQGRLPSHIDHTLNRGTRMRRTITIRDASKKTFICNSGPLLYNLCGIQPTSEDAARKVRFQKNLRGGGGGGKEDRRDLY